MTVYVWRSDAWYDKETGERMEAPDRICCPTVRPDTPGYYSVASGKWVDGARERREDLLRTGCRPAPPEMAPKVCHSKKWAAKLGLDYQTPLKPRERVTSVGPITVE